MGQGAQGEKNRNAGAFKRNLPPGQASSLSLADGFRKLSVWDHGRDAASLARRVLSLAALPLETGRAKNSLASLPLIHTAVS